MRCSKIEQMLSAYVDERLEPAQRQAVDAHLASCEACTEELEIYLMSSTTLRAMGPAEPPADLAEIAARAAFTHEPEAATSGWDALVNSLRWPAMGTAGAAVALAIGLTLSVPQQAESRSTPDDPVAALMSAGDIDVDDDSDVVGQTAAVLGEEE